MDERRLLETCIIFCQNTYNKYIYIYIRQITYTHTHILKHNYTRTARGMGADYSRFAFKRIIVVLFSSITSGLDTGQVLLSRPQYCLDPGGRSCTFAVGSNCFQHPRYRPGLAQAPSVRARSTGQNNLVFADPKPVAKHINFSREPTTTDVVRVRRPPQT